MSVAHVVKIVADACGSFDSYRRQNDHELQAADLTCPGRLLDSPMKAESRTVGDEICAYYRGELTVVGFPDHHPHEDFRKPFGLEAANSPGQCHVRMWIGEVCS